MNKTIKPAKTAKKAKAAKTVKKAKGSTLVQGIIKRHRGHCNSYATELRSAFSKLIIEHGESDGKGVFRVPLDDFDHCLYDADTDFDGYEEDIPDVMSLSLDLATGEVEVETGYGEYALEDLHDSSIVHLAKFVENRKKG